MELSVPVNNYLFNFSSSYAGGGLKILQAYLSFFENKGGAYFILNDKLKNRLGKTFKNNIVIYVKINKLKRFLDDEYYLRPVLKEIGDVDLYFSYGIPIYSKVSKNNWFHLSNLIPVNPKFSYLSFFSMLQMLLLGYRIKKNQKNINFLSADSQDGVNQTLDFLERDDLKTQVLKNGINSDLLSYKEVEQERCAITIGTQKYKDLCRLYELYQFLKKKGDVDFLKIIGSKKSIPKIIKKDPSVVLFGEVPHSQVIEELRKSKVYISSSMIENSSIASLEGLYFCPTSYLSTICSHLELIKDANLSYEFQNIEYVGDFYKITEKIPDHYVKSICWDNVNSDFDDYLKANLKI